MEKVCSVRVDLPERIYAKLKELADVHHDGDTSAMLLDLAWRTAAPDSYMIEHMDAERPQGALKQ